MFLKKRGKMKSRTAARLFVSLLVLVLLSPSALSWARHDQMTSEVVRDLGWLDRFDSVKVTEYLYDDPTVNQIKIRYYNENPGYLGPNEFFYHALYENVLFFKGAKLGNTTSAKQILSDFSDEPDWELDQNLELSWMQGFSGESQGYRHMYYPRWTFHVPMGFSPQGQTPERVTHFYSMAKSAFESGDTYWGFRFLARALHYVQDMSQPYHTRQLYFRFISPEDPYFGTIQTIKNYHFAYESYQSNLFRLEQQGEAPKNMISAIRYSLPIEVESPEELTKYIAQRSYWRSSVTMKSSIDFLGTKYTSTGAAIMTPEDFFSLIKKEDAAAQQFQEDINERMVLFGKATKSFLEYARKDLNLDQY
jgi:hypothetical protein